MYCNLSFPACLMATVAMCPGRQKLEPLTRDPGDEKLGFEGCVAALGMLLLLLGIMLIC